MLRELLRGLIIRQGDMRVVGEAVDPLEVLYLARKTEADVVITTLPDSGEPGISSHLLAESPDLVVVALAPDGNQAMLYRQILLKEELGGPAGETFVDTLRQAASRSRDERPD